jgi:hypothetical protein
VYSFSCHVCVAGLVFFAMVVVIAMVVAFGDRRPMTAKKPPWEKPKPRPRPKPAPKPSGGQ